MRWRIAVLMGFLLAFRVSVSAAEDYEGLPDDLGREAVYFNCTACHSIRLVTQQHLSRDEWNKLLTWMVETNGMEPLKPWARTRVLNYLATHFGPQEQQDDFMGLRPGPQEGREIVFYTCQACHSLTTVTQQGLDRRGWDATLTMMTDANGMPPLDPEERAAVLNYLAAAYGPD